MLLIAVLCFTQLSYAQELFDHPRSLEDLDGDDNQILDGADADGSPGSSSSTGTPVPDTSGSSDAPNLRGKVNVGGKGDQSDYDIDDLKPLLKKFNQVTIDKLSYGESINITLVLKENN